MTKLDTVPRRCMQRRYNNNIDISYHNTGHRAFGKRKTREFLIQKLQKVIEQKAGEREKN